MPNLVVFVLVFGADILTHALCRTLTCMSYHLLSSKTTTMDCSS